MAQAIGKIDIDIRCSFTINECEARALDALAGYGDDKFIEVFYEKLGAAYMRDHEAGLRTFLKTIRGIVSPAIHIADKARQAVSTHSTIK